MILLEQLEPKCHHPISVEYIGSFNVDPHIQQLERAVAGRFSVDAETKSDGLTVTCRDLLGEPVASRVLTHEQLGNTDLVSLVLQDLERQLLR